MRINKVNPATLKITDMRFADIDGAPKRCTLVKFYKVPDRPGFGIDELNEKLILKHPCRDFPPPWSPTDERNREWANDRRWS